MELKRIRELLESCDRIAACGCGGACGPCQREAWTLASNEEKEDEDLALAAESWD